MPPLPSAALRRKLTVALVVLCAAISATAFVVGSRAARPSALRPPAAAVSPAGDAPAFALAEERALTRIDSLHLTLRATGFEPSEIAGRAGHLLLAVDNMTGSGDVTLRLTHESGARLREGAMPLNKARWREVVNLPPGLYTLTDAEHPDRACRISITEK